MIENKLPEGLFRVNEQYFSGGAALDNFTMNNGQGRDNYGYRYNTRALLRTLEMRPPAPEPSFMYIDKGSHISAKDQNGNDITGPIIYIIRDGDHYITSVTVLSDKTRVLTTVNIDTIKLIGIGIGMDYLHFVRESCSIEKAVVAEMIREERNIDFKYNKKNYKAIVEAGMPTILELFEGKVMAKYSILDIYDDNMINTLLKLKK